MNGTATAGYVWAAGLVAMASYEVYALVNKIPGDTLSEGVWWATQHYLVLPLIVGLLCGHFFGQQHFHTVRPMIVFCIGVILGVITWQAAQ